MMMDMEVMMNLGNKQILSYWRDLGNSSECAFWVKPGMNCDMMMQASAFLSSTEQESVLGTAAASTTASLPKMQPAHDRENRNTPLLIRLF